MSTLRYARRHAVRKVVILSWMLREDDQPCYRWLRDTFILRITTVRHVVVLHLSVAKFWDIQRRARDVWSR